MPVLQIFSQKEKILRMGKEQWWFKKTLPKCLNFIPHFAFADHHGEGDRLLRHPGREAQRHFRWDQTGLSQAGLEVPSWQEPQRGRAGKGVMAGFLGLRWANGEGARLPAPLNLGLPARGTNNHMITLIKWLRKLSIEREYLCRA